MGGSRSQQTVTPQATPEQQEQRFEQLARQILSKFPPKN